MANLAAAKRALALHAARSTAWQRCCSAPQHPFYGGNTPFPPRPSVSAHPSRAAAALHPARFRHPRKSFLPAAREPPRPYGVIGRPTRQRLRQFVIILRGTSHCACPRAQKGQGGRHRDQWSPGFNVARYITLPSLRRAIAAASFN